MKIRTLTYGITRKWTTLPVALAEIEQAGLTLQKAANHFTSAGLEVQTTRLSLPPVLAALPQADRPRWLKEIYRACAAHRLEFVSLGTYHPHQLTTPEVIDIIATYPSFNLTTPIAGGSAILPEGILQASQIMRELAHATPDGLCNFRYAAIANCEPGIPFFPASYQQIRPDGQPTLSLGLQMPELVSQAIRAAQPQLAHHGPPVIATHLAQLLSTNLAPIQRQTQEFCNIHHLLYTGIDVSPAPLGDDSIVAAFELTGLRFGEAGTLATTAAITNGLKASASDLRLTGYNGLMLPVLEDRWLGERVEEGLVDVTKLLAYSAVCGTGLDVIPLPGEVAPSRLQNLLYDVAALSTRYNKPLSARLFPVPGRKAGERTTFDSPYLTNTIIMNI